MPRHLKKPMRVKSAGNKPKIIDEFIGRINSETSDVSIARMKSPPGWIEPPQTPEFDEYTLVLKGSVHVKTDKKDFRVTAGELFFAERGLTVQYSTPEEETEYIAICLPAFSADKAHRGDK